MANSYKYIINTYGLSEGITKMSQDSRATWEQGFYEWLGRGLRGQRHNISSTQKVDTAPSKQAEKKAWRFFRQLVNNDESYFAFKNKKEPMNLKGSDGGTYYLYPDGNLARIDKDKPYVGRISFGQQMPFPDFLSAIYVWVTKNEHIFKKMWGCGNISLNYKGDQLRYDDGAPLPDIRVTSTEQRYNTNNHAGIYVPEGMDNIRTGNSVIHRGASEGIAGSGVSISSYALEQQDGGESEDGEHSVSEQEG